MIRAVVIDIEGTATPIAFVHRTLFPYARARIPAFVAAHGGEPGVAAALDEVRALAPGQDAIAALLAWLDADAKVTPLKTLQGMIWREGFERGDLRGEVYPDVAPALRGWQARGMTLAVYSSGSAEAQRLLFGHSTDGDLAALFSGFFDTRVGAKREAASYRAIAAALARPPQAILFLSDVEAELDAARVAGFATCQLVRPADGTVPSVRHRTVEDFTSVPMTVRTTEPA